MNDALGTMLTWICWGLVAAFIAEAVAFTVVIVWGWFAGQGAFEVDLGDVADDATAAHLNRREGQ